MTTKVKLGSTEYEIAELTVRQLKKLRIGLAQNNPTGPGGAWEGLYDRSLAIIATAVTKDDEELRAKILEGDFTASEDEVLAASREILLHAGLIEPTPSIAELRNRITASEKELQEMRATLTHREAEAKRTGEASAGAQAPA